MSEYNDNRSESDANENGCESDASYRPELDFRDNTNNEEIKKAISGSVISGLDSLECTRKRPQKEKSQVEATVPPQESCTAVASTDTCQAEQKSSPNV